MANLNLMPSAIDLPIEKRKLEEIVTKAKDWALMHGVAMRSRSDYNPDTLQVNLNSNFIILYIANIDDEIRVKKT